MDAANLSSARVLAMAQEVGTRLLGEAETQRLLHEAPQPATRDYSFFWADRQAS